MYAIRSYYDDIGELVCNGQLAHGVILLRQFIDHLVRAARGALHRGHTGAVFV